MKIMFQNYSNKLSTEANYLSHALRIAGVNCEIWANPNVSAYDALDSFKPDVMVTHYRFLGNDVIKYIERNGGPDLVLNVTGANPEECESIEKVSEGKINIPFVFTNAFNKKEKFRKLKLNGIYPAADIFLQKRPSEPAMALGILNEGDKESVEKAVQSNKNYHLLSLGGGEYTDIETDVAMLHNLYHFYERFVIAGSVELSTSQIFFDSCLACHKVDILPQEDSVEQFNKFLGSIFKEPEEECTDIGTQLKKQIVAKHTPFNRAERLMRFLKNEEAVKNLQKLQNQVVKGQ
ncbi:MAG: hypothetical protein FI729_01195 [SAR202 cluster bacterium]|nr:hypothetical protein [SAR202 cluster bacterium]|tara:strand:- start:13821 stop:14696 length:876 start_codon:yes stop_codon:yes gene_type:complete